MIRVVIILFALEMLSAIIAVQQPLAVTEEHAAPLAAGLQVVPPAITASYIDAVLHPGESRDYPLLLINPGDETLFISEIIKKQDQTHILNPDWLTLSSYGPITIPAGDTVTMSVRVQTAFQRLVMKGEVQFVSNATSGDTLSLPILCGSSSESLGILSTGCISLAVTGSGNMGWFGIGYFNMNFAPPAECDTGNNSRGHALRYLHEASPVVMRGEVYRAIGSWDMFGVEYEGSRSPNKFKWLSGDSLSGPITGPGYTSYHSGVFCTVDSLVAMENSWYAPTHPDSCNFIIQQIKFYPRIPHMSVSKLAIGEVVDWDIPSDEPYDNRAGHDSTRSLAYIYGIDKMDDTIDCQPNGVRFGGASLLRMYTSTCGSDPFALYGAYNVKRDSFRYPADGSPANDLLLRMYKPGYSSNATLADLMSILAFKYEYTLPANDTLTVWLALATVRNADSHAAGLDSLNLAMEKARKFSLKLGALCYSTCCWHQRGNLDGGERESPDLSDLSLMIAHLTTSEVTFPCPSEADIDGSGGEAPMVDLLDLSCLVGFLTLHPQPDCVAGCPR